MSGQSGLKRLAVTIRFAPLAACLKNPAFLSVLQTDGIKADREQRGYHR
jgi:hypothetical protein